MGRTRRVQDLAPADLAGLTGPVRRDELGRLLADPHAAWARSAQEQWGMCGVALLDEDDQTLAHLLVCPGLQLPSGHPLAQWSRTPDGACLLALAVADELPRPEATVRHLVQRVSRRLVGQASGISAVGCDGAKDAPDCLEPPTGWLAQAGFAPVEGRQLGGGRRMELPLDSSLRWQPDLNRAWQLLAGLVPRPLPPTEPTGRGSTPRRAVRN